LLQVVHNASFPQPPELHAVGVEEWSWRRGHRYGTIVVNLETHRVVDLLPERSTEAVAQWLAPYPGITVVSRDRSDLYAKGITQGAPRAVQVVDRFPLVANLREALEAFFLAHPTALKQAAATTAQALAHSVEPVPVTEMYRGRHHRPQNWRERQEHRRQQRHAARVARYQTICQLYNEGMTVTAIARRLHITRKTIYAQLQRGWPPGTQDPYGATCRSRPDPFPPLSD
jgi:transposase